MRPSTYKPKQPAEFIGSAHLHAQWLDKLIAQSVGDGTPMTVLLIGPPGTGKTELSNYFSAQLGCDRWHVHRYNGTQLKIEAVEDIARSFTYKDLFGAYRVLSIEEVDKVPVVAQVRLLTLLDNLPSHTAVICTSNCHLSELEERFQSRFMVIQVKGPDSTELAGFLQNHWPALHGTEISSIILGACGNVRQALKDADLALLAA